MKGDYISAFIILIIACVLFGCDVFQRYRTEGFESGVLPGMCGVDLAPCPPGLRCMNGYCKGEDTLPISLSSGLPVKPEGYIRL